MFLSLTMSLLWLLERISVVLQKMYGSIHKDAKAAIQKLRTPRSKTSKVCAM